MRPWFVLSALFLALPLSAQWPGQDLLGVQGRLSFPGGELAQAVGTLTPGLGLSVQTELHFEDKLCARLGMGLDSWFHPGKGNRSVAAYDVAGEVLYFLRNDDQDFLNGPYLVAGLSGITWALSAGASNTGSPERSIHAGITGGFGYRLTRHLDCELKIMASQVNPGFTANATIVCLNYWF